MNMLAYMVVFYESESGAVSMMLLLYGIRLCLYQPHTLVSSKYPQIQDAANTIE